MRASPPPYVLAPWQLDTSCLCSRSSPAAVSLLNLGLGAVSSGGQPAGSGPGPGDIEELFVMSGVTVSVVSGCDLVTGKKMQSNTPSNTGVPRHGSLFFCLPGNSTQNPHLKNNPFLLILFFSIWAPMCTDLRVWSFSFIITPSQHFYFPCWK